MTAIILARYLGKEEFGVYSLAIACVTITSVFVKVGFSDFLVKKVAELKFNNSGQMIHSLLNFANLTVVFNIIILLIAAGVLSIAVYGVDIIFESFETISFSIFLLILLSVTSIRSGAIRGYGNVILGQLPDYLIRTTLLLAFLLIFELIAGVSEAWHAVLMHVLAAFIACIFSIVLGNKLFRRYRSGTVSNKQKKSWLVQSLPFTILSGVVILDSNIDLIMIGFLLDEESVGLYRVASQSVIIIAFTLSALNAVIAPKITKLYKEKSDMELQNMITLASRLILLTSLPVSIFLMIWSDEFLIFVFGQEYKLASIPLFILCIGQIVNSMMGVNGVILNMTNYAKESAYIVGIGAVLNMVLNAILIPYYGIVGAAIATATSLAVWNILLTWRVYYHLKVNSTFI